MKNLWRILILFMLPGLVLGGNSIAAFYRLTDGNLEPLAALSRAGIVWSASAYIVLLATFSVKNLSRFYYQISAVTAVLFTCVSGSIVAFYGNGTFAAMTGIAISGAATAWTAQSFIAKTCSVFDRWNFIAGVIISAAVWAIAGLGSRLAWMETLFYYLAIILLITWLFASPLTRWGSCAHRRIWQILLAGCAIGGFYAVPLFSSPPPATAHTPGRLWSKTYTTLNGRRFILQDSSGKQDLYTPQGRLLMPVNADENLQTAALALLNIANKSRPAVQLIILHTSVLPGCLKKASNARVLNYRLPQAMRFRKFNWKKPDLRHLQPQYDIQKTYKKSADIVLLTALPENQYPVFVKRFLQYTVLEALNDNGITAVPSYLLKNPAVFCFMHENFPYSGALPTPGELWVFSQKPLDLSVKNISKNMQSNLGGFTQPTSELFEILYSSPFLEGSSSPSPSLESIKYGSNKIWGSWWWLLWVIAAVILWRSIRLFGERRNIMYSCFNAMENGFSGMGTLLLVLSLLLVNNGANVVFIAIAAISFVFFLGKWNIGGVWAALGGLLLVLFAICNPGRIELWLLAVIIQTASLTGCLPSKLSTDVQSEKQMLQAVCLGIMAASLFTGAVWLLNIPLLPAWSVIFLARLPGIWQYAHIGVYYNNTKQHTG